MPRLPPVTSTDLTVTPSVVVVRTHSPDARGYRWVLETSAPSADGPVVLETEADLQPDLEVLDATVLGLTSHLRDLEPVDVPQRLRGALDPVPDRLVDAVGRGADDLGDPVGAVRHVHSSAVSTNGQLGRA